MLSRRTLATRSGAFLVAAGLAPAARAGDLQDILGAAMAGTAAPALGALVVRNGEVAEVAVRGVRRIGRPEPVQLEDAWLIGSCTKPMTAALIARLVDRGALSWTAPLSVMLPELSRSLRADYRPVTLTQLLSHQSGLPHDDEAALAAHDYLQDRRPLPQQRLDYVAQALEMAPVAPPGTAVHYSNIGYALAAVIAEQRTGVAYEELMRRDLFEPLGMSSAMFGQPQDGQLAGHWAGAPAKPTNSTLPKYGIPPMYGPAGFARLSLSDWARFCLDQLAGGKGRGGGGLLSPQSYRLMQTPLPGSENGIGWGLDPALGGRKGPVLEHDGTEHTWYAVVVLFPATGDGVLAAANAGAEMGGEKAAKAVLRALLPTVSAPV